MANNVALGKLRTTHTVTAASSIAGVFSVSNSEAIVVGSSFSKNGTGNVSGLYARVQSKNYTTGGVTYDIALNWGITVSVGDTVYFDYDTYGLKIAKKNANVDSVGPKDLIFDSRLRRRGTIYASGFQSTMSSAGINFKGSKQQLAYIPLVITNEDRKGSIETESGGFGYNEEYTYTFNAYRSLFQTTKTTLKPIQALSWAYDSITPTFGRSSSPNNSVLNLSFKALRIPCAYGFMTDTYFKNAQTTDQTSGTTPGSGTGTKDLKGKKRVFAGKLTNSNLGYSNLRGIFVSRTGTDIDTCNEDDILMTVDDGKASSGFRGEEQLVATNYSTAVSNTAVIPTATISTTVNTAVSNTFSVSVFNPYTFNTSPTATTDTTSNPSGGSGTGATSISTSVSTSGFTDTITYSFSATSGTFNLSSSVMERPTLSLF